MQTLGIFGGSFDPIHYGHLTLARIFRDTFALNEVKLIPTGLPPHRPALPVSPQQRADWVRAAIAGQAGLTLDEREVRREGYCYTIDTLAELQREHPDTLLVWLIGADSLANLPGWRRWQDLLDAGHLVVAARPGVDLEHVAPPIAAELQKRLAIASPEALSHGKISVLPAPLLPVSSTELRARLARGQDIGSLTPVAAAITASGLYQAPPACGHHKD
ncbi:nicotinate-nucleotide adenylyltransferase [Chitinilyticum litopenaei]|uniref:nicotinate-nucleotide adenylyltransferase n=1 Tax=Chitinilyticum litopenaei TaxID=1121276 RepID=UPI00130E37A8|nr:nicotinate-nucleotide adenylyltransferase [Chitinilyticum litopenaei]